MTTVDFLGPAIEFNGTTPVTVVAGIAATRTIIKWPKLINRDTADVTITLTKVTSGPDLPVFGPQVLAPGDSVKPFETITLEDNTQSITGVMSGAPATTQPCIHVSTMEVT